MPRAEELAHDGRRDAETTVTVRIEALAPGGDAVGRQEGGLADGRATFVSLAAPGERVQVRITREKARVAWGELALIDAPSPHRVSPPCPLFGRCGGCQWQHVDLATQRSAKRAIVARALGLTEVSLVVPVEEGGGYRDRAQLILGRAGEIGLRARRSHDVVDVERCLLLSAPLQEALTAIRRSARLFVPLTEIDLQAGREGVHVAVRPPPGMSAALRPPEAGERGAAPPYQALLDSWRGARVVGLLVMGPGGRAVHSFGLVDVDIDVDVAGRGERPLRVPAGAFAQVGRAANQALLTVVLEQVGPSPGNVLELHAGSGNFTRYLADRSSALVACDSDAAAIARGRQNVSQATWLSRPPHPADADLVLADPPRAGLDAESLRAVLQARRSVVYVSCDPQTLGRDAVRLAAAGFVLRRAVALDLMPHTHHVEVVATFQRAGQG